jgi:uncharacterized membrane protein YdjX (TVP38/TMEM64 family)
MTSPSPRAQLLRVAPLLAVAGAMLVVFAMGWHGTITLENIIAWRDRSHLLLAEHPVLSVLVYVLIYVTVATLSLPGGLVLTLAGGLLFGTLVGGIAAIVGATIGATRNLIARALLLMQSLATWPVGSAGCRSPVRSRSCVG